MTTPKFVDDLNKYARRKKAELWEVEEKAFDVIQDPRKKLFLKTIFFFCVLAVFGGLFLLPWNITKTIIQF
jgi:hypothetical protein